MPRILPLAALSLALLSSAARAEAASSVNVQADNMEIVDAEHKTIFRGNVVAVRPSDTIKADEMTVFSSDQKQSDGSMKTVTDHVEATGGVNIVTRGATIVGDAAHVDMLHDHMVVTGAVTLTQGTSVVRGKRLDVDLKTFHVQMSGGGGRVSGTFVP